MITGRPRRTVPSRRFNLTLDQPDADLLEAYAREVGQPPTRVAGQLFRELLRGAQTAAGRVDRHQVDAVLRTIRGEPQPGLTEPRWEWPIDALLADRRWWDRWLPDLNELLGRKLANQGAEYGKRAPIVDRRGYSDLLEFLFPTVVVDRDPISWRSPDYPRVASQRTEPHDGSAALAHVWESVIRHVATALSALERTSNPEADPAMRILTQDHITGPWLRTLRYLTGEKEPDAMPSGRIG